MTDTKELQSLASRIEAHGAKVLFTHINGEMVAAQILKAKGIGGHPMSLLSAAERMREWLYNTERAA